MHQRSFKNIRGRISKKHSSCPDELHHRKTLRQNIPFYGHLSDTFVQLTIIFERICQKRNLKVEKNIFKQKLKKKYLFLKNEFIIFFGNWAKFFRHFDRNLQRGYQNCILRVQRKLLRKTRRMFFFEIKSLSSFSDNEIKFFGFLTKDFRQD